MLCDEIDCSECVYFHVCPESYFFSDFLCDDMESEEL